MEGLAFLAGLASGTILGWYGHVLAKMRSRDETRRQETLKALNATIEYVDSFAEYHIHRHWSSSKYEDPARERYEAARRSSYMDLDLIPNRVAWSGLVEYVDAPMQAGTTATSWIEGVYRLKDEVVASLKEKRASLVK